MSPCIHYLLMTLRSAESEESGKWFGVGGGGGGTGVVPELPAHLRPTFGEQLFGDTFLEEKVPVLCKRKKTSSRLKRFSGNKPQWFLFLEECQLFNLSSICQEIAPCDGNIIFSPFLNP